MKPFINQSTAGNEKAFRLGQSVPKDGVNLAYVNIPQLTPEDNMVIVDTSRVIDQNANDLRGNRKMYYANGLGILVDENWNTVVADEFPSVTDVFSVDEDWSKVPGSEYTARDILPFVHVSRHFHVDHSGLTLPGDLFPYDSSAIKVVDGIGREYLDSDGHRRYKIKIIAAQHPGIEGDVWGYRVHAFVDDDENENLYLQYNKVEIDVNGLLKNQRIGFKEKINPQPVFEYRPEESEVVDLSNRKQKIYSSKSITYKDQVLGRNGANADGYQIFVPKKAIGDPRLFQLFRWRINCTFTKQYTVDPSREQIINCGVLVTTSDLKNQYASRAPRAFYNLQRSAYNASGLTFRNPAKQNHSASEQMKASYWYVNLDTDDLSQYDILISSPNSREFDYTPHLPKISNYIAHNNGTLFIDSNSHVKIKGFKVDTFYGVRPDARSIYPVPGHGATSGILLPGIRTDTLQFPDKTHDLIAGLENLGGWQIGSDGNNEEELAMTFTQRHAPPEGYNKIAQRFSAWSSHYKVLMNAKRSYGGAGNTDEPAATWDPEVRVPATFLYERNGNLIISTLGMLSGVNSLTQNTGTGQVLVGSSVSANMGELPSLHPSTLDKNIGSIFVEGAYKFLYNACLLAVRKRTIDNSDEQRFSTSWTYSSEWQSSWVVDGDVLFPEELDKHNFTEPEEADLTASTPDLRLVRKRALTLDGKVLQAGQIIDQILEPMMNNPATRNRIEGSVRKYELEVTNPYVKKSQVLNHSDYVKVWTDAYSPKFEVPAELGAHVIKEEPVEAKYNVAHYLHREYPSKPYACQVFAKYSATEEETFVEAGAWVANGTATETTIGGSANTGSDSTQKVDAKMSWWTNPKGGSRTYRTDSLTGMKRPEGIQTWQERNYYSSKFGTGNKNWPCPGPGLRGKFSVGDKTEKVQFIQECLNLFRFFNFISHEHVKIDGIYGNKTKAAVLKLQNTLGAQNKDGVVNAETWYLIGSQIIRAGQDEVKARFKKMDNANQKHIGWLDLPFKYMAWRNISNNDPYTVFGKVSDANGPSIIWEMLAVTFDKSYKFHGVTVQPYLPQGANSQDIMVRSIDVRTRANWSFHDYDSDRGKLTQLPYTPKDGKELYIPFGPYTGDTIIIGIGQKKPAWDNNSRFLGVRNIWGHARVPASSIPNNNPPTLTNVQKQITLTDSGMLNLDAFTTHTVQARATGQSGGELSNIKWTSVSVGNPEVTATITPEGLITFYHQSVDKAVTNTVNMGQIFPSQAGTYYSKNENGVMNGVDGNPIPENGMISKSDGLKLLCDIDGKPVGFPAMPTDVGWREYQRHYTQLSLASLGTASEVQLGFYDFANKEFVTDRSGRPVMSYIEYMVRGPQNIFIAVVSTSESISKRLIPVDADAPMLPYKWAMPVYGLHTKAGSRINLQPLPKNLGVHDLWPVAVRNGRFNRSVTIRSSSEGAVPAYLSPYRGTQVRAFYGIPESENEAHSTLHGPPYVDVKGEEPLILDDDLIQVRQTPIHMVREPTASPSLADPVRPIFTVYTRETRAEPWVQLGWPAIKDWDVSEGMIWLKNPLRSNDPSLVKVDYTTTRRHYYFKKFENQLINLNMYPGHSRTLQDKALYIYLVPEYVKDEHDNTIPNSVNTKTLRLTTNPSIFDPMQPEYDPLIVQLGVVYTSTALDPSTLAIMDTRRRGGGLSHNANLEEVVRIVKEASTYWDVSYHAGTSYQKGGYVVIRLPEELKTAFTKKELKEVIDRNITAGVGYKIEDLAGQEWD